MKLKNTASAEEDISLVWLKYSQNKNVELKNRLVIHYIWLVRYVLQSMSLPTNSILDEEDFLSIGILGLHEAIDRFELDRGVKFESYAIPRIRGIIQDELRRLDWLSRTARKKAQDLVHASDELRSRVGREVSDDEIMRKLNISPEEYNSYLAAAAAAKASFGISDSSKTIYSDDDDRDLLDEIPDPYDENTLDKMEDEERINFITDYLKNLTERKRQVMSLYYYENITFKEIGKVINVSESRVCQIHSQVVIDLRAKLKAFDNQ